jgi:hypothetical protein
LKMLLLDNETDASCESTKVKKNWSEKNCVTLPNK